MNPKIILREVAAATVNLLRLAHPSSNNLDLGSDGQAIALRPCQLEAYPVASRNAVISQNHGRAIEVLDDGVHVAVIEEISDRQPPRDALLLECRAGLIAGITESPTFLVEMKQFRLTIAASGW